MAKQGFAASDRRKVEVVTDSAGNPDLEIKVHDCGTVFVLATQGAIQTLQLPKATKAGDGWWCRVVSGGDRTANGVIKASAGEVVSHVLGSADGTVHAVTVTDDAGTKQINFIHGAIAAGGDEVEILCANGQWFVRGTVAT